MMGVCIKGMKMPKDCVSCRFHGFGGLRNELVVCMFTGTNDYMNQQDRFEDCPLIELPTPHGRLIDADALLKHEVLLPRDGGNLPVVYTSYINNAPTIIPADKDGE